MKSPKFLYIFAMIGLITATSCKSRKDLLEEPLRNKSAASLVNKLEKNEFDFEWMGMKLSSDIETAEQSESFKATMRVRKDSMMWVSISPALGVEMIRMLVSSDSVKYVSKIPNNKHYYSGDYSTIEDFLGVDVTLGMMQDLIIGNPVAFDPKGDKFNSQVDGRQYVLTSKYKRKMEKVVGADDKDLDPDLDSLYIDPNNKTYLKLVQKKDEDDLIIKRYYLNSDFRLEKTVFLDLYNNRTLIIEHSKFDNIGAAIYPTKTRVEVQSAKGTQTLEFEISRLKLDKVYDFPYDVPEDYERKYN